MVKVPIPGASIFHQGTPGQLYETIKSEHFNKKHKIMNFWHLVSILNRETWLIFNLRNYTLYKINGFFFLSIYYIITYYVCIIVNEYLMNLENISHSDMIQLTLWLDEYTVIILSFCRNTGFHFISFPLQISSLEWEYKVSLWETRSLCGVSSPVLPWTSPVRRIWWLSWDSSLPSPSTPSWEAQRLWPWTWCR